ncbi:MAG: WD40/YVTN/BNR-like repeat-containing protein [Ramlibacter sp.]
MVTPAAGETVVVTLPPNAALQVGDHVRVSGQGSGSWQLAQNAQQYVVTTNLPGNVVPGTVWTPRDPDPAPQPWFGSASSASGNRIAAIANPGGLYLSADGGATWTRSSLPTASWAGVAMNSEGSRLAAVAGNGLLYTSADYGQTWVARTTSPQPWTGVSLSDDGQRIVATATGGSIWVSINGGTTFTPATGTAGADWRAVAGSSDGMRLVAVASCYNGNPAQQGVYVSVDGGATWTNRNVTGPTPPTGNWTYASASADGQRLAAIDNGGNPWISDDGGTTWTMRFGYSNWSGLAVSGDGRVVSALEPRDDSYAHNGYVFISTSGGADGSWNFLGENRWYRGVSLSFDGNWVVVGDAGLNGTGGRLYTSQGNRTSGGTLGSITGGAGQMVEVTYQGNGQFTISNSAGGPFTIR